MGDLQLNIAECVFGIKPGWDNALCIYKPQTKTFVQSKKIESDGFLEWPWLIIK